MKKYNCIIVDDKLVDRLTVLSFVKKYEFLNVIGIFESATEALSKTENQLIDVLFLDIDMPNINGLEFRKSMQNVPVCVFITAHPEHAAESFDLETLDFMVKPLNDNRFLQTVNRIETFFEINQKATLYDISLFDDSITIKEGHHQIKIKKQDVIFLEALKDYTVLVTTHKKYYVLMNIKNVLLQDNFNSFVRIHRSYATQKQYIQKIGSSEIELTNQTVLPVGRAYKDNLKNLI